MKTFQEWLEEKKLSEVSKPVAATVGWFLGGPVGAKIGHHLGRDDKEPSSPPKPEPKHPRGWASQSMVDLSPEELLQKGAVEGEIIKDIYAKNGRSIETRLPNGVRSTKFIGTVGQVPREMVNLSADELIQKGIIQGGVIKDDVKEISPGVRERWITTKSNSGIETIKYIGNL